MACIFEDVFLYIISFIDITDPQEIKHLSVITPKEAHVNSILLY